jgi:hypothetical protein
MRTQQHADDHGYLDGKMEGDPEDGDDGLAQAPVPVMSSMPKSGGASCRRRALSDAGSWRAQPRAAESVGASSAHIGRVRRPMRPEPGTQHLLDGDQHLRSQGGWGYSTDTAAVQGTRSFVFQPAGAGMAAVLRASRPAP